MRKLLSQLPLMVALFHISFLNAQDDIKFGKIAASDLAMTELASDTAAEAYVLYDVSNNRFEYETNGPRLLTNRHRRVKLLKRSSFDRADVEIYVNRSSQRLSRLKAMIHLPDGETIQLRGKDFIRDDASDDYQVTKFTFPQVTEGAVIEYTYTLTYDYITSLPRYYFQEDIPVRWSEYEIHIPEYYRYVSLSTASADWHIEENDQQNGQFAGDPCILGHVRRVLKDLPAYEDEPYNNNFRDFLPQMYFQLSAIQYPRQAYQPVLKDWKAVAEELADADWFGRAVNNRGDIRKVLEDMEALMALATTEREKIEVAYRGVTSHMNWNEDYTFGARESLNKCWEKASGTSGEMNLILLGVLREMGVEAHPVLVSLRNRGSHVEFYPVISQFDHTLVLAKVEDQYVILDAGSPYRPIGLPRFDALNHRGWIANPENPQWIDINVPQTNRTVAVEVDLDETGMATAKFQTRLSGYYGLSARENLAQMDDDTEGPLVEDVLEVIPEAVFVQRNVKESNQPYAPLTMEVDMEVPMGFASEDYLYVTPILIRAISKGLADNESRYTPIDLGYSLKQRYIATVNLPEGYEVEDMPEPTRVRSEDNSLVCSLITGSKAGTVTFNLTVEINRALFKPEEYQGMREIFKMILDMQDSQLVLRRAK